MTVNPADTFEMELNTTTVKASLSNNLVPTTKTSRKVYGILLSNAAAAVAAITFTIELDLAVERTIPPITLPASGSMIIQLPIDSPLLTIPSGRNIKSQVTVGAGPIATILQAYDLN